MNELRALEDRVLSFMESGHDHEFLATLNALVAYQRAWNPRLAAFWHERGFAASPAASHDVPAVPTDVFRYVELHSTEAPVRHTFRTSGTTSGARGQSSRLSTRVYDYGALRHVRRTTLPGSDYHFVNLVLDPREHPDSSLSHMVGLFNQELATSPPVYCVSPSGLDTDRLTRSLRAATGPTVVFGTAFAFVMFLDEVAKTAPLPEGSIIVETGGFKGKTLEVGRTDLYRALAARFEVPVTSIRSEYSMTELSSQLYSAPWDLTGEQRLTPPPWCEVSAVDPETLAPLPAGTEGLLRFVDLANVDTVVAIQTSDLGTVHGDSSVVLRGRALGALPRGCSLAVEEILELQQHTTRFT